MYTAAASGHVEILQYCREKGCEEPNRFCEAACAGGNLKLLQDLHASGYPWAGTCPIAAKKGHLEILKWALSAGAPLDSETFAAAARAGQLETLKWLKSNGCPTSQSAVCYAAQNGHQEVVEWLLDNGAPYSEWCYGAAASAGNLNILKMLWNRKCPVDEQAAVGAVAAGQYEILQWLVDEAKVAIGMATYRSAFQNGNLGVLKRLQERE